MDMKDLLSWVTLAIAVLGAVLGVLNAWRAWSNDRIRLRVKPVVEVPIFQVRGIQVVNLSSFPVTLLRVGWMEGHPGRTRTDLNYPLVEGNPLPVRIEPRGMVEVTSEVVPAELRRAPRFWAETACGTLCVSSEPEKDGITKLIRR